MPSPVGCVATANVIRTKVTTMGSGTSRVAKENKFVARFASTESLDSRQPFYNAFLAFQLNQTHEELEALFDETLRRFANNDAKTSNFSHLVDVFLGRSADADLIQSLHTRNALVVIKFVLKFFVETTNHDVECRFESPRQFDDFTNTLAFDVIGGRDDLNYQLQVEAVSTLLILLSQQRYSSQPSSRLRAFKTLINADDENGNLQLKLVVRLLENFSARKSPPVTSNAHDSFVLGFASGVWNVLTLNSGASEVEENFPLSDVSLLLLLVLT